MKLEIVCVGKTRQDFLAGGIAEYEKRLQPFAAVTWRVLPAVQLTPATTVEVVKEREAKALAEHLGDGVYTIVLDERGREMDSPEFSGLFDGRRDRLRFIIGGTYGLAPEIRNRADLLLSCSRFTLTHEMIRLVLVEQIYRAFTIRAGKKYHY